MPNKHTFVWAGILFCIFSVVVSTFGTALVNPVFGSGRDVVSSGLSTSSSAPGKKPGKGERSTGIPTQVSLWAESAVWGGRGQGQVLPNHPLPKDPTLPSRSFHCDKVISEWSAGSLVFFCNTIPNALKQLSFTSMFKSLLPTRFLPFLCWNTLHFSFSNTT